MTAQTKPQNDNRPPAKAAPQAATEPTPRGLQYVIPGCEKDQTRGPAQMSLF